MHMMMQAKAKMHMQANTTTKALAQGADAVDDAFQLAYDDGVQHGVER